MGDRQAEYDIQGTLETYVSKVESDIIGPVTTDLSKLESKLDGPVTTDASKIESKIDGVVEPDISVVDSNVDALIVDTSKVESKLDGPITTDVSKVESKLEGPVDTDLSAIQSSADVTITETSKIESKVETIAKPFGTSFFKDESSTVETLVGNSWVTIYESGALDSKTAIKALKITNQGAPTGFGYRVYDGTTKLFPFGASKAYTSGEENVLAEVVQLEKGESLLVEVFASEVDGGSATLTSMKIIQYD